MKKYTIKDLYEKYIEFQRRLAIENIPSNGGAGIGGGSRMTYRDTITSFLFWLEDNQDK